jgi:hypothetical protein
MKALLLALALVFAGLTACTSSSSGTTALFVASTLPGEIGRAHV